MKSSSFPRGARFAFLILASAASSAATLALGAPADSTEVTAPQMIDAFEGDFGVHPGQRRNHSKGTCAAGEFVGTTNAAALSRSALFSGKERGTGLSVCDPLDGIQLRLEPGQTVIPHGPDRDLTVAEVLPLASGPT